MGTELPSRSGKEKVMGYEIDFLAVGKESKSGDAIALRYGDLAVGGDQQRVIVIDGGFTDDGQTLVQHIRTYFGTNTVDVVVSTHPDQDHVSGLRVVLEEMDVGQLWMHLPWAHSYNLAEGRKSSDPWTGYNEKLQKSLAGASEIEELARRKGITIREPFAGLSIDDGGFRILGPTAGFYEQVLGEIKQESLTERLLASLREMAKAAVTYARETLHLEMLGDDGTTSPQNDSSAICLLSWDGNLSLFTGDAGIRALEDATALLESDGYKPGGLRFMQVPHHGSRRNVSPAILDRLLGPKGQQNTRGHAFVSAAPKGEPKHPSKKVANAFRRRGYTVYATQGQAKWHYWSAPARLNYDSAEPLPFYDQVEHDNET
jgi:beta-lactamase superfamily II metal-dependent hydrolase